MEILLVGGMFAALGLAAVGLSTLTSHRDAVSVLILYMGVLFLIPARLVFPAVGGAGTPAVAVGLFCLLWWLISKVLPESEIAGGAQPVRTMLLVFGGWALISYAFALRRYLTDLELPGADRMVLITAAAIGAALVAVDGIPNRKRLDTLISWMVGLAAVVGFIGVIQFFTPIDPVSYIRIPILTLNRELSSVGVRSIFNRPASTALHPIEFGVVMAMVLPLAMYRLSLPVVSTSGRIWRIVCVLLVASAIPITVSRSAILGAAIAVVIYSVSLDRRGRFNVAISAVLAVIAGRVLIPGLVGTLSGMFLGAAEDPSVQSRLSDQSYVLDQISVHPWLGFGFGTYNPEDYLLLDNQYFVTTISAGVPGLVTLLALVVVAIVIGRRAARRAVDSSRRLGYALVGSVAASGVALATFDGFSFRMFTGLFFLMIGITGAYWRIEGGGSLRGNAVVARDGGWAAGRLEAVRGIAGAGPDTPSIADDRRTNTGG